MLIAYLCDDIGIQTIKAFVMPENKYSERVLMNNGFTKDKNMVQGKNWGGKEVVGLHVFNYKNGYVNLF